MKASPQGLIVQRALAHVNRNRNTPSLEFRKFCYSEWCLQICGYASWTLATPSWLLHNSAGRGIHHSVYMRGLHGCKSNVIRFQCSFRPGSKASFGWGVLDGLHPALHSCFEGCEGVSGGYSLMAEGRGWRWNNLGVARIHSFLKKISLLLCIV